MLSYLRLRPADAYRAIGNMNLGAKMNGGAINARTRMEEMNICLT
jgi:hypothetical protein